MAYVLSPEEELKNQQMAAAGGASVTGAAPRQSRSGNWVNLQKYLGGGDQTAGLQSGIESQKQALEKDVNQTISQLQGSQGYDWRNPIQVPDYTQRASDINKSVSDIGTESGRFELLKKMVSPSITGGQQRLNEYILSRGAGQDALSNYYQQNQNIGSNIAGKITPEMIKNYNDILAGLKFKEMNPYFSVKPSGINKISTGGLYDINSNTDLSKIKLPEEKKNPYEISSGVIKSF